MTKNTINMSLIDAAVVAAQMLQYSRRAGWRVSVVSFNLADGSPRQDLEIHEGSPPQDIGSPERHQKEG